MNYKQEFVLFSQEFPYALMFYEFIFHTRCAVFSNVVKLIMEKSIRNNVACILNVYGCN